MRRREPTPGSRPPADLPPEATIGGTSRLAAELEAFAATARSDEAIGSRRRERWLRHQADEEATFAGVLLDLAERGRPVVLHTRAGRQHRGLLRVVGQEFCLVEAETGQDVLLRLSGVAAARHDPAAQPVRGDRHLQLSLGFGEAVVAIAGDQPRVLLVTDGTAESVVGRLRAVGRDVLTVLLDGRGGVAYVPLDAVMELSLDHRP